MLAQGETLGIMDIVPLYALNERVNDALRRSETLVQSAGADAARCSQGFTLGYHDPPFQGEDENVTALPA
jgi:hypothetical protein